MVSLEGVPGCGASEMSLYFKLISSQLSNDDIFIYMLNARLQAHILCVELAGDGQVFGKSYCWLDPKSARCCRMGGNLTYVCSSRNCAQSNRFLACFSAMSSISSVAKIIITTILVIGSLCLTFHSPSGLLTSLLCSCYIAIKSGHCCRLAPLETSSAFKQSSLNTSTQSKYGAFD